jgi:surfactin family lipopeptide synthetase C
MSMKNVEDVYPLSPLQQGLLFHSAYQPGSGLYFVQTHYTLGRVDAAALEQAWQRVIEIHPILRTAFLWNGLDEPLQVVRQQAKFALNRLDWRELSPEQQQARLDALIDEERSQGFNLGQAPLMRVDLIQTGDEQHRLVWSFHHLLLDGWSKSLVINDLLSVYNGLLRGQTAQIQRPRPYHDYIAWLQQQDMAAAERFWRRTLKGFTSPTPLRFEPPRAATSSGAGFSEEHQTLSKELTTALHAFARQHQLTLNTVAQGAWAMLLSRYSGEQDIVFGATTSGRPSELRGVEQMVGLFINTLPVRVQVVPDEPLVPWLQALQAQQVELREYEYSPLVQVQGWSDVPRGKALFENILVFESYPATSGVDPSGLTLREVQSVERTNYPLEMMVVPGDALQLKVLYDTQRFDVGTIRRVLGHFHGLLQTMIANPRQRLGDLPILTAAEYQELVIVRNATAASYPKDRCYHELVEAQVARTPDAIAVEFGEQRLSYAELNARANRLAHHLGALGIGPGGVVGICMERSIEMLVGLLGILKAGAAFLPLDPAFPAERMQFMLEDAQVTVLLTQERLRELFDGGATRLLCLDGALSLPEQAQNPRTSVTGDHLAYVIYTSGSTGRPKGVLIPHSGLVNYLDWCREAYTVAEGRGAPVHSSIAADAIFPSLFAPLLVGTTVVMLPESRALQSLRDALIAGGGFSMIKITPTQLDVVNQQLPREDASGWVRTLVVGAEAVRSEVLTYWQQHAPETILLNEYGPTETVVGCSIYQVPPGSGIAGAVPIGLPIANTQFYVLDARMQPVPVGVPGELYIGGDGVAWGYLNRPQQTATAFVPDPFNHPEGTRPGARLYKTGDVVRYLPDRAANIEFLGRIDHQVKIRGYRVEPGEIESVLVTYPGVREAVVMAREDTPGELRLVAYVVENGEPNERTKNKEPRTKGNERTKNGDTQRVPGTENGERRTENGEQRTENGELREELRLPESKRNQEHTELSLSAAAAGPGTGSEDERRERLNLASLRAFLQQLLPEYMVPAAFVVLDELPLTTTGKLDRRALPVPDAAQPASAAFVAPRTPVELVLASLWSQMLNVQRVSAHDNFFNLGGHSLLAIRLVNQVRKVLQVVLPLQAVFEAVTLAEMAEALIANEPKPGQTEKIAQVLLKVKGMTADELRTSLDEHRS